MHARLTAPRHPPAAALPLSPNPSCRARWTPPPPARPPAPAPRPSWRRCCGSGPTASSCPPRSGAARWASPWSRCQVGRRAGGWQLLGGAHAERHASACQPSCRPTCPKPASQRMPRRRAQPPRGHPHEPASTRLHPPAPASTRQHPPAPASTRQHPPPRTPSHAGALNPHEANLVNAEPLKAALRGAGALEAAAQVRGAAGWRWCVGLHACLHAWWCWVGSLPARAGSWRHGSRLPAADGWNSVRACTARQHACSLPPITQRALRRAAQVAADHAGALQDAAPTIQTVRSLWRLHK